MTMHIYRFEDCGIWHVASRSKMDMKNHYYSSQCGDIKHDVPYEALRIGLKGNEELPQPPSDKMCPKCFPHLHKK